MRERGERDEREGEGYFLILPEQIGISDKKI